jgi:putative tryptophan/tyrosine transport system substrate-binding protein
MQEAIMTRRTLGLLITLALALLVAPLAAAAPPGKIPLIGVLRPTSSTDPLTEAFRQGLRELGYVEGHTIRLEERFAEGQYERLPELAVELVRLPVDILVTDGPGAVAAKHATDKIPIVFAAFSNPVEEGLVASLARPGENLTGFSPMALELAGKRLELLSEMVPSIRHMALVWNPRRRDHAIQVKEIQAVAARGGIHLDVTEMRSPQEFDHAFATMSDQGVGAAIMLDDAMFYNERTRLVELAAQRQMPTMYGHRGYVEAGGLLSYGPNYPELFRRAATFVDKILKGAQVGELPVEQSTTLELVINLKTAEALGLTIPPTLLFQATEIIR